MIRNRLAALSTALAALALAGCDTFPPIDFQRMIVQEKFTTWQSCRYFADGRAMRPPPEGALPRDAPIGDPAFDRGVVEGGYVTAVPVPLTRELLTRGRGRFETYCAACHGLLGDGDSWVARNMDLRRPPAIAGPGARDLPPGRIYQVIEEGYGLMRSYAEDLTTPEERWSVVAYLEALNLSHGAKLSSLPLPARERAYGILR